MSTRAQLLRHIADLAEEDVRALLTLVERLRAKHPTPPEPPSLDEPLQHPERFGVLSGSVGFLGDVELPVADPELWTLDTQNVGS